MWVMWLVWIFCRRDRSVANLPAHSQVTVLAMLSHMYCKSFQFDVGRIGCHVDPLNMLMSLEDLMFIGQCIIAIVEE